MTQSILAAMTQSILVAGGMGAVLNCALASYSTSAFTEFLAQQLFVQPVAAVRALLPALVGFVWGTLVVLVWHLLKAWVVRFLLDYNGWFLHPRRPVNKVSLRHRRRRERVDLPDSLCVCHCVCTLPGVPALSRTEYYFSDVHASVYYTRRLPHRHLCTAASANLAVPCICEFHFFAAVVLVFDFILWEKEPWVSLLPRLPPLLPCTSTKGNLLQVSIYQLAAVYHHI